MSHPEPATLILSDTHFAHPHRRGGGVTPEQLRPLWAEAGRLCAGGAEAGARVQRLVVNGDVAELQMTDARGEAARQVERLSAMCEADGVELVLLSGNHDAYISDRRHLEMFDGRLLVTHGDALHPAIAPWARGASAIKAAMLDAIERHRTPGSITPGSPTPGSPAPGSVAPGNSFPVGSTLGSAAAGSVSAGSAALSMRQRLEIVQHVAHQQFVNHHDDRHRHGLAELLLRPDRLFAVFRYWYQAPDLASAFLETLAPGVEVFVFGHSHRQGVWRRHGRWIINTGSFDFPGKPRAVLLRGDTLGVYSIVRRGGGRGGGFALRAEPVFTHRFGVPATGAASQAGGGAGPRHRAA